MVRECGIWLTWKYVLCFLLLVRFFIWYIYSTSQINVCTDFEINRFRIDEVRKYATIVCFIWRHVTQKRYVVRHGDSTLLIGIWANTIFKPTRSLYDFRFKSYGWNSGFHVFGDLDLWPMFYCLSHALRMVYWNIHAKFHKNPSSMNGWYAAVKVLKNALCFIMGYLVAMEIRVTLFLLVQFFICYIV